MVDPYRKNIRENRQVHIQDISKERAGIERAKAAGGVTKGVGSIMGTAAFYAITLFLLFGGGGIAFLQEIIKNVPIVVILGVVAILFIFRR